MRDTDPPEKKTQTQTSGNRTATRKQKQGDKQREQKDKKTSNKRRKTKEEGDHRTNGYVSVSRHRKAANELWLTLMHLNHSRERELIGALAKDHARVE